MASSSSDLSGVYFFVKTPTGKTFPLQLLRGFSINQVKHEMTGYEKIPINEMVLSLNGQVLKNTCTLSDYNIQEEDTLLLTRDRKAFCFIYLFVYV